MGKLLYTDLSALEYRIIAHAGRELPLIKAFNDGYDIHSAAFETIFARKPSDEVERKIGKTSNFLGVYGGGYDKFLITAGVPDTPEAYAAYLKITTMYPAISRWKEETLHFAWEKGYVVNLFGRVRQLDLSLFRNYRAFTFSKLSREAINWIVQSSGHDILTIYLMESVDKIREAGLSRTLLVSEVHDAFTCDCPDDEGPKALELVKEVSSNLNNYILQIFGVKMRVPIVAKTKLIDVWE